MDLLSVYGNLEMLGEGNSNSFERRSENVINVDWNAKVTLKPYLIVETMHLVN